MHQDKPAQSVKTLSIRIPLDLYLMISQYALDEELTSLNSAIISLIKSGLDSTSERNKIISQFIIEVIPRETLEKLINVE